MPNIEIDQDIYDYLLRNTSTIGECASSILRRLLGFNTFIPSGTAHAVDSSVPATTLPAATPIAIGTRLEPRPAIVSELLRETVVPATNLRHDRTPERLACMHKAVDRFLTLLGWLEKEYRESFHKVLSLGGRQRQYFAKSAGELTATGTSVHPARIPGCGYWVVTNNDTPKKVRMIQDVLEILGVSLHQRTQWLQAMKGERLTTAPRDACLGPCDDNDLQI